MYPHHNVLLQHRTWTRESLVTSFKHCCSSVPLTAGWPRASGSLNPRPWPLWVEVGCRGKMETGRYDKSQRSPVLHPDLPFKVWLWMSQCQIIFAPRGRSGGHNRKWWEKQNLAPLLHTSVNQLGSTTVRNYLSPAFLWNHVRRKGARLGWKGSKGFLRGCTLD